MVTRGKIHKYVGMMLDFQTPGELQVTMVDYLKGFLEDFQKFIIGRRKILAVNHMFHVTP